MGASTRAAGVRIAVPTSITSGNQRFQMLAGPRGYVIPITLITIAYLMLELGFNARLLDVTGSLATESEVTSIERWGRLISGIAVTLFVWGAVLMPTAWSKRWTINRTLAALTISTALLMSATYVGEKRLVDDIVSRSSATERHAAVELRLLVNAILNGRASVHGIDLQREKLASPEGKSFLALLPLQALSTPRLLQKLDPALVGIVQAEVQAELGSADEFYQGHFQTSIREVDEQFRRYLAAEKGLSSKPLASNPESIWQDYLAELESRFNSTPDRLPPGAGRRVAEELNHKGIMVPLDWDPTDHRTFIEAAQAMIEHGKLQSDDGDALPNGLDKQAFVALPKVQDAWRKQLTGSSDDPTGITLRPNMTKDQFLRAVYQPSLGREVRKQLDLLRATDDDFGPGGSQSKRGYEAMQALVAPPIALLFSLSGGLVHVFKSLRYIATIRAPSRIRSSIAAFVVVTIAFLAFLLPNSVSRSQAFADLTAGGGPVALGARWIVQAQPFAYPVNEWVRTHILGGMTFGNRADRRDL